MEAASDDWETQRNYLTTALSLKTDGNTAYKAKDIIKAIGKYHRSLIILRGIGGMRSILVEDMIGLPSKKKLPKDLVEQIAQLESECYNNLAACLLARSDPSYKKVVEYCNKVLSHDPDNEKAAFRKGTALFHLGQYSLARIALTCQPGLVTDNKVQKLLRRIAELEKKEEKKEEKALRSLYKGMFDNPLSQIDSPARAPVPDPILIKPAVRSSKKEGTVSAQSVEETVSAQSSKNSTAASSRQDTKVVGVDNIEKEAAC